MKAVELYRQMPFLLLSATFVLLLTEVSFLAVLGEVYYVVPNGTDCLANVPDCPANVPCNTLDYYANSTAIQMTNSVLYFMPWTHLLQQIWVIENANYLTLRGK